MCERMRCKAYAGTFGANSGYSWIVMSPNVVVRTTPLASSPAPPEFAEDGPAAEDGP